MHVTERFLTYGSFHTTSDEFSESVPSSPRQKVLGEYLARELAELGMEGAHMDDKGYVYAFLPASENCAGLENIGVFAHMDTAPDASGEDSLSVSATVTAPCAFA